MRSAAATILLVALLVTGCGGSSKPKPVQRSGRAAESAAELMTDTIAAFNRATSWHMSGHLTSTGIGFRLNLSSAGGARVAGSFIVSRRLGFDLVAIADTVYVRGSDLFWKRFLGGSATVVLDGKWLRLPFTNREFLPFTQFAAPSEFLTGLLSQPNLENKGEVTYDGKQVIELSAPGHATLYIAARGAADPVAIVLLNSGLNGSLTFSRWNAPVSIKTPQGAIPISSLGKTAI